ncbi:MAG: hypothetical protein RL021_1288 [Bacteroidota bacterium]
MRYLILLFCLQTSNVFAAVTGMTNNSAVVGAQHLNTTITSNGTFVQAASPNGNVYEIRLQQGSNVIYLADFNSNPNALFSNVSVSNPTTVDLTDFSIPFNAALGTYTLVVGYLDPLLQFQGYPCSSYDSLQGAFTVLPPDGYIQGTVYDDQNKNGQRDAGENGVNNGTILLQPGGISYPLDASGNYSIPVSNGNYSVTWNFNYNDRRFLSSSTSTFQVTVNNGNVTGNDFGVFRKLQFCSPNLLVSGRINLLTVVGDTLFSPGTNNVYSISLQRIGQYCTAYNSSITVVDSSTASARINIQSGRSGVFDLFVQFTSGPNYGVHILPGAATIVLPTATVSGTTYYDSNQNGVYDAGDSPLRGQRTKLMPDSVYAYSGFNGAYSIGALAGSHTISWDSTAFLNLWTLSSDSASYTYFSSSPVAGKDFGLVSNLPPYSHTLYFSGTRARCNTNNRYEYIITNTGNVPMNGRLYLMRDPLTVYNGSSVLASGSTASGDTIWWDLQNIQPFQPVSLSTYLLMPGPQNVLHNSARFDALDANNTVQQTSSQSATETVLCSFDPNDKACTPEGTGIDHYTQIGDELEYKIRFQNTGNDTAYDVRIYDRLDTALDLNSFRIINSSHNVSTTLDNEGQATFFFQNIYLPDSNIDEPGSNGFVTYRIRAKANTPDFTRIENTAYIVFDLNPAVVTNTTFNTMVTQIPLWVRTETAFPEMTVAPNPFRESTRFLFAAPGKGALQFALFDLSGRVVRSMQVVGDPVLLERNGLNAGIYLYRFTDSQGSILHTGKVVIE